MTFALSPELFARANVRLAILFGSRARGEAHAASDWDIGIVADEVPPESLWRELSEAVEGRVDLVDLRRASPLLCERAMRHGRVLFDRDGSEFARFASLTVRRYADTAKLRRAQEESIRNFVSTRVK